LLRLLLRLLLLRALADLVFRRRAAIAVAHVIAAGAHSAYVGARLGSIDDQRLPRDRTTAVRHDGLALDREARAGRRRRTIHDDRAITEGRRRAIAIRIPMRAERAHSFRRDRRAAHFGAPRLYVFDLHEMRADRTRGHERVALDDSDRIADAAVRVAN